MGEFDKLKWRGEPMPYDEFSLPLRCPGVGRNKDCINELQFYFNRRVTDDEMEFLHEVMKRAVASIPSPT